MHLFEKSLSVGTEDVELELRRHTAVEWIDFLLNPRRLRGSDSLMRWPHGVWSEERIIQAIDSTREFFAIPHGPIMLIACFSHGIVYGKPESH